MQLDRGQEDWKVKKVIIVQFRYSIKEKDMKYTGLVTWTCWSIYRDDSCRVQLPKSFTKKDEDGHTKIRSFYACNFMTHFTLFGLRPLELQLNMLTQPFCTFNLFYNKIFR